jgi:hypothetical protein
VLRTETIAVLVSSLDAERYGVEVWRDHGQDPHWLEGVAREHHEVLQAVVEQADVVPLRLPGIYQDRSALESVLHKEQATFEAALARVRGRVEWGAKVFLVDPTASQPAQEPAAPRSGRDYLARKSAQATAREESRARRQDLVLEAHETLSHTSGATVVNAPQDRALSGRAEPMLLNAAYLVARGNGDAFLRLAEDVAERLREDGMSLEVTGPWPPYNFAAEAEPRRTAEHAEP